MKIKVGDVLPKQVFETVTGQKVSVPDAPGLVHLQFRRFVGCPICNTHIRQVVKRADEIRAAGIRELIFFHSPADDVRGFHRDLPFDLVADPTEKYYQQFGVGRSLFYFLNPQAIWAAISSMVRGQMTLKITGTRRTLPADVLVGPTGEVIAVKYGQHAYDQWTVDELLSLAARTEDRVPAATA